MSGKSAKVQRLLTGIDARGMDSRYAAYFVCFDRGDFFEAHEVLEDLWLEVRKGPDGDFFKGLIQLAGAFVHLQKNRLLPADALLALAVRNLEKYPTPHRHLAVHGVIDVAKHWRRLLSADVISANPLTSRSAPCLGKFFAEEVCPRVLPGA